MPGKRLTHLDEKGAAHMVDIGHKPVTKRKAVAQGHIYMSPKTRDMILGGELEKGDAIATARLAAIMAAKNTASLIPLCHPLPLSHISIDFTPQDDGIAICATVSTSGRTGVEMEALTAVSLAALTLYDMAKAVERSMQIGDIHLISKSGGASSFWTTETTKDIP